MLYRAPISDAEFIADIHANQRKYMMVLRALKDWTMRDAARAMDVSRMSWHNWENGKALIKNGSLLKFIALWEHSWPEMSIGDEELYGLMRGKIDKWALDNQEKEEIKVA